MFTIMFTVLAGDFSKLLQEFLFIKIKKKY